MKLTKTQLKQIIKEELEATMEEEAPMQESFMQDAAMKLLSMFSPGLAETAELAREYPEFAKAVARHSEGPEGKAVSNNLQIAGAAGGSGNSQLRRALEKDEAEVVRALDDFVAGGGSSSRAFAMALPGFLEGGDKIDLNLGMRGGRFRKR